MKEDKEVEDVKEKEEETGEDICDSAGKDELMNVLKRRLEGYRDVKTRKMDGFPLITMNPKSSMFVKNLKVL